MNAMGVGTSITVSDCESRVSPDLTECRVLSEMSGTDHVLSVLCYIPVGIRMLGKRPFHMEMF